MFKKKKKVINPEFLDEEKLPEPLYIPDPVSLSPNIISLESNLVSSEPDPILLEPQIDMDPVFINSDQISLDSDPVLSEPDLVLPEPQFIPDPVSINPEPISMDSDPVHSEPDPVLPESQLEPDPVSINPDPISLDSDPVLSEPDPVLPEPQLEPDPVSINPDPISLESNPVLSEPDPVLPEPQLDPDPVSINPDPISLDYDPVPSEPDPVPPDPPLYITPVPSPEKNESVYIGHTLGVSNMKKNFGKKAVVRGVNFSMKNGEVAGLLGPNGAGKTTIFYMIVGFYKPTMGNVIMDDVNITSLPMYKRARMGIAYLPQESSIFRKLTVEKNIWAILESRKDINKKQKKERLETLLIDFNITRIRKQFGYTLSGGERRRTEIARALATEPKFLLLDEPFAGIDPIAVYEIKQIVRRLADNGIGILITDHNVRDTLEITNEAFIIADGLIVAKGDKDSILNNDMVRKVYLGNEFKM